MGHGPPPSNSLGAVHVFSCNHMIVIIQLPLSRGNTQVLMVLCRVLLLGVVLVLRSLAPLDAIVTYQTPLNFLWPLHSSLVVPCVILVSMFVSSDFQLVVHFIFSYDFPSYYSERLDMVHLVQSPQQYLVTYERT